MSVCSLRPVVSVYRVICSTPAGYVYCVWHVNYSEPVITLRFTRRFHLCHELSDSGRPYRMLRDIRSVQNLITVSLYDCQSPSVSVDVLVVGCMHLDLSWVTV